MAVVLVRGVLTALAFVICSACVRPTTGAEITRDRAIALATQQVPFPPSSVTAVKARQAQRRIWRVTLRGHLPAQPSELFETYIVEIDRLTGVVLGISRT